MDADDVWQQRATSFGEVAETYDPSRAGYPRAAIDELLGTESLDVLDVGAGTGKLTRVLVEAGHRVHAVEPSAAMLAVLRRRSPTVATSQAGAEALPLPDESVDAVLVAQARHWFDVERTDPEMHRVLRPGGVVGLLWNVRDPSVDWIGRYDEITGAVGDRRSGTRPLAAPFTPMRRRVHHHEARTTVDGLVELAASRSSVSVLDAGERERVLARVRELATEVAVEGVVVVPYRLAVWSARRPPD